MNRFWKNNWKKIRSRSNKDRTHHKEVENILSKFEFDIFIDCGAGYAGSEAWSVRDIKPEIKIIGFEPQTERYNLLKKNGYPDELYKFAVGKKDGKMKGFMGHSKGKSDFWLYGGDSVKNGYNEVEIEVVTLDNFLKQKGLFGKRVFIWGDVEGSELDIILGCKELMNKGLLIGCNLELSDKKKIPDHCTAQEVIDELRKHNIESLTPRKISGTHKDFLFKLKR